MDRNKKVIVICAAAGLFLTAAGIITTVFYMSRNTADEIAYRETAVEHGNLTVGITESGNVETGTATQELKLDISAYSAADAGFSFQMDQMDQMGQMGAMPGIGAAGESGQETGSGGSGDRSLEVEQIYVTEGQQIAKGDALFRLTEESVEAIRSELANDVTEAELTLRQLETEQKSTALSARHDYEANITYGEAAQVEYDEAIEDAAGQYEDAAEALQEAQERLTQLQEEEKALTEKYAEDAHLYDEAAYLSEYIDKEEDPYGYVQALVLRDSALSTMETTEDNLKARQEEIEEQEKQIETLSRQLTEVERSKRLAEIEAKAAYDMRTLKYQKADELYAVETGLIEEQCRKAREEYESAQHKLEKFDSAISDNMLLSEYAGVITDVLAEEGDYLAKGTELITLNDYGDVTVTVSVEDDDIGQIAEGDAVNIYLTSFPDQIYTGVAEEISDAQINSSSEVEYDVTVRIEGDVSGIYGGMSCEVTFVTKETREVDYVSNRAVNRDGNISYVLVYDEEGNVVHKVIKTGFSDGVNVEILDGLAEGDIVLIESKVGGT